MPLPFGIQVSESYCLKPFWSFVGWQGWQDNPIKKLCLINLPVSFLLWLSRGGMVINPKIASYTKAFGWLERAEVFGLFLIALPLPASIVAGHRTEDESGVLDCARDFTRTYKILLSFLA